LPPSARNIFYVEEYTQLSLEIARHQLAYQRIELLAFGGIFPVYAFLFSSSGDLPWEIWWVVPVIYIIAAIRCGSYYFAINFTIARHISKLECKLYPKSFSGYQSAITNSGWWRGLNLFVSACAWSMLIIITIISALFGPTLSNTRQDQPNVSVEFRNRDIKP
jgi:hypothetical protein